MAKSVQDILDLIKEKDIKMVDFKMVDINGQYRHVTIPAENFSEDTMKSGIGFDASNYGYAVVEKSDMVFIPDPDTAVIDPFCSIPTLSMTESATANVTYVEQRERKQRSTRMRVAVTQAVTYAVRKGLQSIPTRTPVTASATYVLKREHLQHILAEKLPVQRRRYVRFAETNTAKPKRTAILRNGSRTKTSTGTNVLVEARPTRPFTPSVR